MTSVCTRWNEALLEAIRVTHPGPPVVARALAVAHTCMFDAWAAYNDRAFGTRTGELLRRPESERTNAKKGAPSASLLTVQQSTCSQVKNQSLMI